MPDYQNGIIEDLGAVLGVSATNRLIAVFGGRSLYVPETMTAGHPIALVLGELPAARLVEAFGGETLSNLPTDEECARLRRVRDVAELIKNGINPQVIGRLVGVSTKQVVRYRAEAETLGLLPVVFGTDRDRVAG